MGLPMTTAIDRTSRARDSALDDPSPIDSRVGRRAAPAEIVRGAISAKIDADLAAFIESVLDPKPTPKNDEILYVGVNAESVNAEARALEASSARVHRVTVSSNDGPSILPKEVSDRIAKVLEQASPGEREMLAAIACAWAPAERGSTSPSRLVISGHSGGGSEIFGYEGQLTLKNVRLLAHAMPHAASQVEDIHLSACSTSGNGAEPKEWRAAFPNMKSLWCYDGSAPSPASAHLAAWSQMTRGRSEPRISEDLKHANVGLWTKSHGYHEKHRSLETVRNEARAAREHVAAYFAGTNAPVVQHYRALRRLSVRADATPAERARAKVDADVVLRVRYYPSVRAQFAEAHGAAIERGFRALGLPAPDFAKLSRKEALAVIASFENAIAATPLAPILRGLATLDPNVVLERWCAE
jgi:hypothetical protein